MTALTLRFAFPGKNTNFAIYSGSFNLGEYAGWFVSGKNPRTTTMRITLYKTFQEAEEKHGPEARRVYSSKSNTSTITFFSLVGSVKKFLGVERNKDAKFSGVHVPVHEIERTDTSVTLDLDLTGEEIFGKIKKSIWRRVTPSVRVAKPANNTVASTSKSAVDKVSSTQRSVDISRVEATAQKVSSITLTGSSTLKEIKRLGFNLMLTDSANKPFVIEITEE